MNFQTTMRSTIIATMARQSRAVETLTAGGSTAELFGQRVDPLRQREVKLRQPAFAVGGKD
jgi:hypothetical protein